MKNFDPDNSNLFDLPSFDVPQIEHRTSGITWEEASRMFESQRREFLLKFYRPEDRLRSKNPERFVLD